MSQTAQALSKLNNVVSQLEGSIENLQTASASAPMGGQPDMFGANVNTNLVAQKLDSAISKIEDVLSEGEQAHG